MPALRRRGASPSPSFSTAAFSARPRQRGRGPLAKIVTHDRQSLSEGLKTIPAPRPVSTPSDIQSISQSRLRSEALDCGEVWWGPGAGSMAEG